MIPKKASQKPIQNIDQEEKPAIAIDKPSTIIDNTSHSLQSLEDTLETGKKKLFKSPQAEFIKHIPEVEDHGDIEKSELKPSFPNVKDGISSGKKKKKGIIKRKSNIRAKAGFKADKEVRVILWTMIHPLLLKTAVEAKKVMELRKEVEAGIARRILEQTKALSDFIQKHCSSALNKLYKEKNSMTIVNDGSIDGPNISRKDLKKRFTLIIV